MTHTIPTGYAQWVTPDGRVLLVPSRSVPALLERLNQTAPQLAGEKTTSTPRITKWRADAHKESATNDWRKHFGKSAPAGHLRVLLDFDAIASGVLQEQMTARRADRDENDRLRVLLDRLKARGPDRMVGRPANWARSLDELEQMLPHFRSPIEVVRNAMALADVATVPVRIPPLLLLGPPGVGKTLFSQKLAELCGVPNACIAFDQANAGSQLYGTDKFWGNTQCGLLFQLLCEGEYANPVVLLDEVDKASDGGGSRPLEPLAQLHGALEVQSARRAKDASIDIEFDASMTTYVATANSLRGIGLPLLSRFEVCVIDPPTKNEAVEIARAIAERASERLGLAEPVAFERRCRYVLAHMSPRLMVRTVDKAVAEAVAQKRRTVTEQDVWRLSGLDDDRAWVH